MEKKRWLFVVLLLLVGVGFVLGANFTSSQTEPQYNSNYDENFNPKIFIRSVLDGDVEKVKYFIENKIDPNVTDSDGRSALFIAVREKNDELVDLLLKANADPNIKDFYGDSPLKLAKDYNDSKLIEKLIGNGASE